MSNSQDTFERLPPRQRSVLVAFSKHNVDFIVIGGVAEIYYGIKRRTDDLDVLIQCDRRNANAVVTALTEVGDLAIAPEAFVDRLTRPLQCGIYFDVDILTSVKGFDYATLRDRAVVVKWNETPVRVVAKPDLLALKADRSADEKGSEP